jgi:predicted RNase H-like nuclease (RuvC/YqgF family)
MVQIKLSIAFVLAAAAIAPVVAQPIGQRGESIEAREEGYPNATPPSRREYADEFEVRDVQSEEKLLGKLERKVNRLQREDRRLERTHRTLERENKHLRTEDRQLQRKERRLERENEGLEHKNKKLRTTERSLEREDRKLLREKNRLTGEVGRLGRKDRAIEAELKHPNIGGKGKKLEKHDEVLPKEGGVKNKALVTEPKGKATQPIDKVPQVKTSVTTRAPSKGKLATRDFEEVEFDARDFDDELYLD